MSSSLRFCWPPWKELHLILSRQYRCRTAWGSTENPAKLNLSYLVPAVQVTCSLRFYQHDKILSHLDPTLQVSCSLEFHWPSWQRWSISPYNNSTGVLQAGRHLLAEVAGCHDVGGSLHQATSHVLTLCQHGATLPCFVHFVTDTK